MAGPLTRDDIEALWLGAVDDSFSEPLVAAGEGEGYEAYTQVFEQLARVSLAVDRTTQELFLLPHSGQTSDPAGGEAFSEVTLTFTRTARYDVPLVLGAGLLVGEVAVDWGPDGGEEHLTGRRYVLVDDVVLAPGETGPITVVARAELPGRGYDNPMPGTIRAISQPGSGLHADRGSISVQAGATPPGPPPPSLEVTLQADDEPDMFVPEHVLQYVSLDTGANAGLVARMVQYAGPDPTHGSAVVLEALWVTEDANVGGIFQVGERVQIDSGGPVLGYARVVALVVIGPMQDRRKLTLLLESGTIPLGANITGQTSGSTATAEVLLAAPNPVAEARPFVGPGGAGWRVLDWTLDLGLAVTNAESPMGGRLGMLDLIGRERDIPRADEEQDEPYRERVSQIADVVSPGAVMRTLNRTIPGDPWCLREVGMEELPGFFFDGDEEVPSLVPHGAANDAYDVDCVTWLGALLSGTFKDPAIAGGYTERVEHRASDGTVKTRGWMGTFTPGGFVSTLRIARKQDDHDSGGALAAGDRVYGLTSGAVFLPASLVANPQAALRRFRVLLGYQFMRAFFAIGLQKLSLGEFGFAYDDHPLGAYDAEGFLTLYDGYPAGNAAYYRRVRAAIDRVRAGGVSFALYQIQPDDPAC